MPETQQVAEQAAAAQPGQGGRPQGGGILPTILRMAFMWYLMNWMKGGQNNKAAVQKDPAKFSVPKFDKGTFVDMYVFMNEKETTYGRFDMADLVWSETGIPLAMPEKRHMSFTYEPSKVVQNNGSVYLHAVFARAGATIDPREAGFSEDAVFGKSFNLIAYLPKPKNTTGVNLLSGDKMPEVKKEDEGPREIISYLKPNVTIQTVDHFQVYPKDQIPGQVFPYLSFDKDGNQFPIVFFNDFWLLRDYLIPMNETLSEVTVHLDYGHTSMWWWQLTMQFDKSFDMQRSMGLQSEGESDEIKRVFIEGNPYLLGLTMVVSLLHTVFDMLAFKNDIGFWKNNKSMEGLSARSVLINAACQLIILLYLFDNETSYVVLFSSVLGTGIEFWKVTKAMKVTVSGAFPYIKIEDRSTYSKSKTKQYDAEATRYLSYALFPLILGYAGYALMYKTHKSWYSYILNTLVSSVYMFGFILMCPQLYLNYKLKSVAHLPWRQMTYKFLNTIIDDLFAFVIKMPLLHRLSVFRDDVIFLIYLYQRWIYRVDMKRVNEFGWAGEADDQAAVEGDTTKDDKKEGSGSAGADELALKPKTKRKQAQQEEKAAVADDTPADGQDSKKDS